MRGLKVAIVDMQDFSAGTSSRSSKLAHGGIRYLAHGDLDLVKEATQERNWMRAHIPHLVRPIPFLFIQLEGGKYKKRDINGAVKIYDYLSDNNSEFKNFKKHQWYPPEEIFEMEPEYIKEGNLGGSVYYDTNVDDVRLTIEVLKEAILWFKILSFSLFKELYSDSNFFVIESNSFFFAVKSLMFLRSSFNLVC
ncbi:Aerobic glycerol-3-phosphate dehydrogenase [subsurface metagenome]